MSKPAPARDLERARAHGEAQMRLAFARSAMVEAAKCFHAGQAELALALLKSGAECCVMSGASDVANERAPARIIAQSVSLLQHRDRRPP